MAHQTHARLKIKRTWYREYDANLSRLLSPGLQSEIMQKMEKCLAGLFSGMRRAHDWSEMEFSAAAHRSSNVAAANVVREHAILIVISRHRLLSDLHNIETALTPNEIVIICTTTMRQSARVPAKNRMGNGETIRLMR